MNRGAKKVLLVRTDRFGEFLLNTPVIRAVKEKFSSCRLCVMVSPGVKELVEQSPYVDEVMVYEEAAYRGFWKTLKLIRQIRKRHFGLAVILNPQKKFHLAAFFAGIPLRVGYNRKLGFLLTHRIEDRKYLGQKHEVEYNLDLVRTIGIDTQDKSLFAPVTKDDEAYADSLLVNSGVKKENLVVALHPWTSDPRKQWPIENFSRLSKGLQEDFSCQVVIIGGKDEVPGAEVFCRADNNLINLTGKLTLRQLAAFFKKCRMLISNDSGPVHLAAAAGAPVLAIFRNDIPGKSSRRWGPWGSGHTVIEKGNLSQITVDEVLAKAKEYLAK